MNYIAFVLVYLYLSNWFQINNFIAQLGQKKIINLSENKNFSKILKKKRNLDIEKFIIFESDKPFAMMPSMFGKPQIIISSRILRDFTEGEMEWVLMHEATHYLYKHNLKAVGLELIFGTIGLVLIYYFSFNVISSLILGVILSILFVQTNRRITEREADEVAVKFCNPKNMISGAKKLRDYYFQEGDKSTLIRSLLGWNILPEERIAIAKRAL